MSRGRRDGTAGSGERILVVCTRYIGDTLLAIPFLRNLRRAHPDGSIDVCAEGGPRAVLAHCPHIDERISWARPPRARRSGGVAVAALAEQAAWLGGRGYSHAYLLKPSVSAAAMAMLAGIPRRIGFAGEASPLLTRRVHRRRGRHQVQAYLDLLRAGGHHVDDARNENWVPPASAARIAPLVDRLRAGRPRVFLAPHSTDVRRHWPADRWRRLATWLVEAAGCEVVLCGGPADVAAHDALREAVGPRIARHLHDVSELVPLADAAALVSRMDLCVGVDSGMVHLSASVGVPSVVLVGPTDPNRWSPWRTPSVVLRSSRVTPTVAERLATSLGMHDPLDWPLGRAEVADIPTEDVESAVRRLLSQRPVARPRHLDLTGGCFEYGVFASSRRADAAAAPALPPG